MQLMIGFEKYLASSPIERKLLHLVKLRASQMNGCGYCVDMHTKDLRAEGETNERIDSLVVWREAPYYSDRERAAFAWTEAVTNVQQGHVPDEVFELVRGQFSDQELIDLTVAITTINSWNRLAISFRVTVGTYQPRATASVG